MAERKSVNKYYPPDWDPSKGSVNKYVGQHPLRDRAKKLSQGILVIRFEMPYNIWCGGCNNPIGMGVRYNAEKSKTGMYYTTPIYKFRMKCHLCDNYFEITTDPKNHDYVILEGARRKEQRWDPKENGQIETEDKAVQKKMVTDPMFKLEHGANDVQKGKKALRNISSLETRRDEWKDDYILNKLARQKFRDEKKAIKVETDRDAALLGKSSLDIPLLKESGDDIKLASLMKYRAIDSYDEKQAQKRKEIDAQPFFQSPNKIAKMDEGSKLDIIKKHIRNSKLAKRTNAFDRMKMNTFVSGSSISKQSLGIKKKAPAKDTEDNINSTNLIAQQTNSDKDSLDYENCCNEDNEDNSLVTDEKVVENTPSEIGQENSIESKTVNCDRDRLDSLEDSDKPENSDHTVNVDTANENKCEINSDIDLNRNKTENCHLNSSLGLVCSYSDTDSDT